MSTGTTRRRGQSVGARRRLDQLDEHAAGVLGVDEVDPRARRCRAAARRTAGGARARAGSRETASTSVDPVGELLDARAGAVEELARSSSPATAGRAAGCRSRSRRRATIASRTPCSSLVSSCSTSHAEGVAVERDRLVEVGHGDADVVDGGEEVRRAGRAVRHGSSVRGSAAAIARCDVFLTAGRSPASPHRWSVGIVAGSSSAICRRHPCPDPSSSPAPAPRSAGCSAASRTSRRPTSAASPSRARWRRPASPATRSTT